MNRSSYYGLDIYSTNGFNINIFESYLNFKKTKQKAVLLFRGLQHYHSIHIKYFTIYIIFFWMELFELNYYRKHFIFPLHNVFWLPINFQSSPWCWWAVWKCFLWFSFNITKLLFLWILILDNTYEYFIMNKVN